MEESNYVACEPMRTLQVSLSSLVQFSRQQPPRFTKLDDLYKSGSQTTPIIPSTSIDLSAPSKSSKPNIQLILSTNQSGPQGLTIHSRDAKGTPECAVQQLPLILPREPLLLRSGLR
jgi:hypothetical protein